MVIAHSELGEEELRRTINQLSEICISQEFMNLKEELERLYIKNGIENALLTAFQDALYAILAQCEKARNSRSFI